MFGAEALGSRGWMLVSGVLGYSLGLIHILVVSPLHVLPTKVTILIKSPYFGYYRTPISYLSASVLFASPHRGLLSQLLLYG